MSRNTQRNGSTEGLGSFRVLRGLTKFSRKLGRIVPWHTRAIATWDLPVELNEYIFRIVRGDYDYVETLRACTLVCRRLKIPAQKYLLDTIFVDGQSIERFLNLVDDQLRFYGYVRKLYFNECFVHKSIDSAVALEKVAPFLIRVDEISIFMATFISVWPATNRFLEIFADNFPYVRSLSIQLSSLSLDSFFDLIRCFPSLKRLILISSLSTKDGFHDDDRRQELLAAKANPPCLTEIGCHINSVEIVHIIAWLHYYHKLEHLTLFKLAALDKDCIDPNPLFQMSRLLTAVGPHVKQLRLTLPKHHNEIEAFRAHPLLSENVSLEELWLDLPWNISPDGDAGHAVPVVLSQISSYRLKKILLSLHSRKEADMTSFPWEVVDELLVEDKFQGLKSLMIRYNYGFSWSDFSRLVPLRMPNLDARGLVSMDTSAWFGRDDFTT